MQSNPWLYDVHTEWRRWRGQRVKLVVLLVGFALVCAFLALALRFGTLLFQEKPAWLVAQGHFYTMASQFKDGRLQGTNLLSLQVLADSPGVQQVSWLLPKTENFELEGHLLPTLQAIYFEQGWFALTGLPQAQQAQGVWLSDRFWRQQLNADPAMIGKFLQHKRIAAGLPILGVLPAQLDRIGSWQPDVWVSGSYQRFLTPFHQDSTLMVDRFLTAQTNYYGIFRSEKPLDIDALMHRLNSVDLTVKGMSMQNTGSVLGVFAGVTLDPLARQHLQEQWELLLLLVIGLGLVLALNLLTVYVSRLVLFQEELRLIRVLGAQWWHLFRPVLLSALLLSVGIAVLAWGLASLFSAYISVDPMYLNFAGAKPFTVLPGQFLAALLLVLLLFVLAGLLPLVKLGNQPLFSRAMNPGRSQVQKLAAQVNLALQLMMALLALNVAGTLGLKLWHNYQLTSLPEQVLAFDARHKGSGLSLAPLVEGLVPGITADAVAWSSEDFTRPTSHLLDDKVLQQSHTIGLMQVSANYFQLMGLAQPSLPAPWSSGVVINQTLATLLQADFVGQPLVGVELDFGAFYRAQTVLAVVPDLPHLGRSSAIQPMAYLPINANFPPGKYQFYLSTPSASQQSALHQWLTQQMISPQFSEPTKLADLLAIQDHARWKLLLSALAMVVLVLVAVLISLSYQVKARLELERHEYGVLLAIGAPVTFLSWRTVRQSMLALLLALPLVLAVQALLVEWGQSAVASAVLFEPAAFVMAALVLTLLTLISCHWPLYKLLRQPVYQVLRQPS